MARESSGAYRFAPRPLLAFGPAPSDCPDGPAPLPVYKTPSKTLYPLHLGGFTAHQTLLRGGPCHHDTVYGAQPLSPWAPSGCTFGSAVLVLVGKAWFLGPRPTPEVGEPLRARPVRLRPSEVGYRARKFVVDLALAQRPAAPRRKAALRRQGGYRRHLEGTGAGGGPRLLSSLDSLAAIVRGNGKVPAEKAAQIIPFLQEIKRRYGVPVALVPEMGVGILAAVKAVFPGGPDFLCPFPFLRDLGSDLLAADDEAIRQRLRQPGLSPKLLRQARRLNAVIDPEPGWVENFCQDVPGQSLPALKLELFPLLCAYRLIPGALEGKTDGQGYGFAFDRPPVQFAQRWRVLGQRLESIQDLPLRGPWEDNQPLFKLSCALQAIGAEAGLQRRLDGIEEKIQGFDPLRRARRRAQVGGVAGRNSGRHPLPLGPIQKAVRQFRQELTCRRDYGGTPHGPALLGQIDNYRDQLLADPIALRTPDATLLLQPQRTHNLRERFFRDFRRGARRTTGPNSMGRLLQGMIADTPWVRNLENPHYLKILLQGQATLEERLAPIDVERVRKQREAEQTSREKVPLKIRPLITLPTFPEDVGGLFQKAA